MKAISASRPLLWLVLAVPSLWILYRWAAAPGVYGYGHAIGDSGDWAAWLLMLTLAVTPIRLLFRRRSWSTWLIRRRRDSFGEPDRVLSAKYRPFSNSRAVLKSCQSPPDR